MATALIHFDQKQKARLTRRARLRGKSFSQEVRNAVDLYLSVPVETEVELSALAKLANESTDRSLAKLDETISYLRQGLKSIRKRR